MWFHASIPHRPLDLSLLFKLHKIECGNLECVMLLQGLIGQYAVPILEEKSVWGTDAPTRVAYMDTQVSKLLEIHGSNSKLIGNEWTNHVLYILILNLI